MIINSIIKKDKLGVYSWGGQADEVFSNLAGDFMRPRINEVI